MIHYSILVPQRDRGPEFCRQLPSLVGMLNRLRLPYEIVCIDDASADPTRQQLEQLLTEQPAMRLLAMEAPAGASVALSVGIGAARGDIVIAIESGDRNAVEQIPHLIARLSRLDMVYARPRLRGWRKFSHRVGRIPRALLLGLDVRQPDCLLWAARSEAVAGIQLAPGMRRYLPWMVARRGFRVGDMYFDEPRPSETIAVGQSCATGKRGLPVPALPDGRRNPMDLFTAWWLCRRWRSDAFHEVTVNSGVSGLAAPATLSLAGAAGSDIHRPSYRAKSA